MTNRDEQSMTNDSTPCDCCRNGTAIVTDDQYGALCITCLIMAENGLFATITFAPLEQQS